MEWFKKHKTMWIVILIFLIFLLGCAAFIWAKLGLVQYGEPESLEPNPMLHEEELIPEEQLASSAWPGLPSGEIYHDPDVVNIMILGTDERTGSFSNNARSDSMILVSLDKKDKTVRMASMERGMGVPVMEGPYEGQYDWLTHMFRYGGADLVLKTIRACFLLDVERYVRFNFNAVETIVDAVGGIDIELTAEEAEYFSNAYVNGQKPPHRDAGMNHLDGFYALGYARLREIDSDWNRVQRQRKVILAVVDKLKNTSLLELNGLVDQVLPLVQTNLSKTEIAQLMLMVPGFLPPQVEQMTVPAPDTYTGGMIGMGGRSLFKVNFDANTAILREFLYGPLPEE